jgi:hypothetical protein
MSNRKREDVSVGLLSLASWLEMKPSDESYDYTDSNFCLNCQFFRSIGLQSVQCDKHVVRYLKNGMWYVDELPRFFNLIAERHPRTFGAALQRTMELLR